MAALPVSVYIEGLVKEYFPDLMGEPAEVTEAANKMVKHLATTPEISSELIKRGQGAIQSVKQKSPTAALRKLAAKGCFDESLTNRRRKVRNSSAHAHEFTPTRDIPEQQEALDGILACLYLFYILLFIRARFGVDFADFSRHGFPRRRLELNQLYPAVSN